MLDRITLGRALVLVLVIGSVFALGAGGALAQETPAESNETAETAETENSSGYTLEDLRAGGVSLDDAPPGVRVDGERMWWVEHYPADRIFAEPGSMQSSNSEYVARGSTIDRNAVYLRTVAVDEETHEETVKVVYWREGTETRTTESGETISEPVARDIIVDERNVSFGAGMPVMEVPLRNSEVPRKVTMWIEGQKEDTAWTFTHDSVATATASGIQTQGDFLGRVTFMFLLPILVGSVISGLGARRAIERAGMGPGMSLWSWLVLVLLGSAIIVGSHFSSIAEILSAAPYLAAGVVIAFVGVVVLESQSIQSREILFIRPDIESVRTPRDGEGADALMSAVQKETIIEMSRGPAIVRSGVVPFLSRLFGSAARVPSVAFQTRIKVPTGPVDEMILVDPEADTVLDYEPEGFVMDWSLPDDIDRLTAGVFIAGVISMSTALVIVVGVPAWIVIGSIVVGALVWAIEPVDGSAWVDPADAHTRSAWVSTMTLEQSVDDAKTLTEAREALVEQQSKAESEIQAEIEKQDSTLVESMLGADIDRSIEDEEMSRSPLEKIDSMETEPEPNGSPDAGEVESDD